MPRKIQCEKCTTALNIPDHVAAGKKLKCPKCEHRFVLTYADASSESTFAGPLDADTASMPAMPVHRTVPPSSGGIPVHRQAPPSSGGIPVAAGRYTPPGGIPAHDAPLSPIDGIPVARADGDLREAFDLPLSDARTMERGQSADAGIADAAALLQERPLASRRTSPAEARAQARRCTRCGSGIPKGMSLCGTCGLDQDSGQLIDFDEDLMPKSAPISNTPPIHVSIVGGVCGVAMLILTIASLVQSGKSDNPYIHYGWLVVAAVAGFAIYGAVMFLLGKSARVLLLALTLCAVVNVGGLIVMPVAIPFVESPEDFKQRVESSEVDDTTGIKIVSVADRFDLGKIKLGVTLMILYAGASGYLMSNRVKKYIVSRIPRDL